MPSVDWRCESCGVVVDGDVLGPFVEAGVVCGDPESRRDWLCDFRRVWSPVGIGRVRGAGGSPSR